KVAAQTFRANPGFKTETAITELGIGEALASVLDAGGSPTAVERVLIVPAESRIGPLTAEERVQVMARSPYKNIYDKAIDRESAYEILKARALQQVEEKKAGEDLVLRRPSKPASGTPVEKTAKPAPRS